MTAVIFPGLGEDGEGRASVVEWRAGDGERVREGDEIVELLTDKAAFTIPAPASGVLRILKAEGTEVAEGEKLGEIAQ